jgi:hypothetical protein
VRENRLDTPRIAASCFLHGPGELPMIEAMDTETGASHLASIRIR